LGVVAHELGLPALAAAMSVSKISKVTVVIVILRGRLGYFPLSKLLPFVGKIAIAGGIMSVLIYLSHGALEPKIPFESVLLKQAVLLAVTAAVGTVAFVGACAVLKVDELRLVLDRVRKKLKRS